MVKPILYTSWWLVCHRKEYIQTETFLKQPPFTRSRRNFINSSFHARPLVGGMFCVMQHAYGTDTSNWAVQCLAHVRNVSPEPDDGGVNTHFGEKSLVISKRACSANTQVWGPSVIYSHMHKSTACSCSAHEQVAPISGKKKKIWRLGSFEKAPCCLEPFFKSSV